MPKNVRESGPAKEATDGRKGNGATATAPTASVNRKVGRNDGRYLQPRLYDQPASKAIGAMCSKVRVASS